MWCEKEDPDYNTLNISKVHDFLSTLSLKQLKVFQMFAFGIDNREYKVHIEIHI